MCSKGSLPRHAILKDNLTLFGYDLRFRAEEFGVGEVIGGQPAELIRTALARAYFCEELARPLGLSRNSSELFLMGLQSTADALLDRPMPQVLAELSLSAEIRTALSGAGGAFGNVYETLFAYEKADCNESSRIAKNSGYSEERDPGLFGGGEHAPDRVHVLIAASTSETKNNEEQAPRRRRLKRASGNDSCVLADSGFPFAGQLNNKTRCLLDVHRSIVQ